MKMITQDPGQTTQRVRVGIIGLAAVLLLIGLAAAIFSTVSKEKPLAVAGGAHADVVANMVSGNDSAQADTPTNEPLVKQDLLALPLREAREHFERAYLQQQLILCNGKVGQLAKRVGMERTHLYRKLRSLGVDFRQLAED